ncbi:uncharacterized protein LAJ45_02652 [Morchella importuna]|uniref:Isochorismatase hydrolase n=1 Tax=Morchella conica CCBAS932 TaxID=1392247 RepID=A0A3N4KKS3_9PEZI|nr:uncharacterized protein H6S33_007826 [Morchella sextelata]XP_045974369.1 uncharacterized protein LAJ45_02652 [Morchella importuna]KAH0603504.1 hypothetical protein H6S33_007826 [Morchella sextelata]KAH8153065.1 hypothetical protein LAJ45_02652 [Morchella importuna]RPB08931.1 Isochorismatase hydrolase [Morchella conica CCBAS932]
MVVAGKLQNPAVLICDMQEKFRQPIYGFEHCVATAKKLLEATKILDIPVYVTTQNRARLGETVSELSIEHAKGDWDKTLFSMAIPELKSALSHAPHSIAIVGIESHICVTQTTLDLLKLGHKVYVLADGVSSCNKQEVPLALARLRAEGAIITSSESWIYEVMGDASIEEFRKIASVVKDTKQSTSMSLQSLL